MPDDETTSDPSPNMVRRQIPQPYTSRPPARTSDRPYPDGPAPDARSASG